MPELPEVETVRRSLWPRLAGFRVAGVEVQPVTLRRPLGSGWRTDLPGARLVALGRRGKYLLLDFGHRVAVLHLGMSGRLVVLPLGSPRAPHTHLVVRFEGGEELHFCDPRRFGLAVLLRPEEVGVFGPMAELGPDALFPEAAPVLVAAMRRSVSPIHPLLLDQSVVAGLGNIYASEALYRAGLRPSRRASGISRAAAARLAEAARQVLEDAVAAGGTTLEDGGFVAADGRAGYFAVRLDVYDREGEPCHRCGTTVRRRALRGRSTYFCPGCQR